MFETHNPFSANPIQNPNFDSNSISNFSSGFQRGNYNGVFQRGNRGGYKNNWGFGGNSSNYLGIEELEVKTIEFLFLNLIA